MSRTTEYLEKKGIPFEAIAHDKAFTTIDEARAIGIDAHQVVKTLLLDTKSGHRLVVIPGDRRLDMRLVEETVGDRHAHLATEQEIERDYPGFELGCLPPLGGLLDAPVFVDGEILRQATVVFAAGSQTEAVKARTEDVFGGGDVTVARLTQNGADDNV